MALWLKDLTVNPERLDLISMGWEYSRNIGVCLPAPGFYHHIMILDSSCVGFDFVVGLLNKTRRLTSCLVSIQ